MGLSFRKRMSLSSRILRATEEALELQGKYRDLFAQLNDVSKELSASTQKLLDLSKELLADAKISDELAVTDQGFLQVVTSHGNYVVGSECPHHKKVHHSGEWFVCVDGGIVNVHGFLPNLKGESNAH